MQSFSIWKACATVAACTTAQHIGIVRRRSRLSRESRLQGTSSGIDAQRPTLVITLGTWVPGFIAPLAPKLAIWRGASTMKALDAAGPLVEHVQFDGSAVPPCTVLALTHPSLRGSNVGRREYGNLKGHAAEIAMLRVAATISRILCSAP